MVNEMFKNGMRPVHPGEVLLEDFLKSLGMGANVLAKALRVPAPRINDVVRGRRGVSAHTAMKLARYSAEDYLATNQVVSVRHVSSQTGSWVKREGTIGIEALATGPPAGMALPLDLELCLESQSLPVDPLRQG